MKIIVEQQVIQCLSKLQAQVEQRTPHSLSATGVGAQYRSHNLHNVSQARFASLRFVSVFSTHLLSFLLSFRWNSSN
jgi:hypothetical protein